MNIIQRGKQAVRWIKERLGMLNSADIQETFEKKSIISDAMYKLQRENHDYYIGNAPHNRDYKSMHLPVVLTNEVGRDVYKNVKYIVVPKGYEIDLEKMKPKDIKKAISGFSEDIQYLNKQFGKFMTKTFKPSVIDFLAEGTVIWRPFYFGNEIDNNAVGVENMKIFATNQAGDAVSVGFTTQKVIGEKWYTLLEIRTFIYEQEKIEKSNGEIELGEWQGWIAIEFEAFESDSKDEIGTTISVTTVPEWAMYQSFTEPVQTGAPWFTKAKTPFANLIEKNSPFGVSLFYLGFYGSDIIKRADKHWDRMEREVEDTELAIHTNHKFAKILRGHDGKPLTGRDGGTIYELPKGKERMFVQFEDEGESKLWQVFNPDPRIEIYRRYMEEILRRYEFVSSQAYGAISTEPNIVTPSPQQLNATKSKNVSLNDDIQEVLTPALEQHLDAIYYMSRHVEFCGECEYELVLLWDASLKRDEQLEITKAQRESENRKRFADEIIAAVNRGILKPEQAFEMLYPDYEGKYIPEKGLYPETNIDDDDELV